ncbi:YadA C-terminal domain-containing protein [Haemophilus influenzae]|uniref:YadA C-terminal domain-containing protein n=1 Tax=Haemophilus influenzae TaxID=727 RepID=UPI001EF7A2C3|nr:YadA C-terminal domain-containing protein [Haemophilus influenzae]
MKRNLLKQSVIAVLIGGATVSNYALAQAQVKKDELSELKKQVKEMDAAIDGILDDNIAYEAEVDAKLDQHSAALGRHTNRLNNLKTIAEKAKGDSSEALDKIEALEEQNDEFLADITTLEEGVDGLDDDITGIQDNISDIEDDVNKNTLDIADLDDDITGIQDNISDIEDDVNKNTLDIADLDDDITGIQDNISDIEDDINQNSADIATNTAAIATHTQRLDNLDNRVNNLNKDLKRGLAAQAALNGLFQPYNVGKLNLTAAVGGYKSQTAVAVGAGYRYNENIAAKAGVAFTHGGSATYNVGVNFEW